MRYRLVLCGDVQQIGYREFVKKCAQKMKLKGSVRNLDDGNVEIYVDVEKPEQLEAFKNAISSPQIGKVEEIIVYSEVSPEYGMPELDFTKFKVIRDEDEIAETLSVMTFTGQKMLAMMEQMLVKEDQALEKQDKMLEKQDQMLEKQDKLADKIDAMHQDMNTRFDALGNKIDAMHGDMNLRFDTLDKKYGVLSETLLAFMQEFRNFNTKLDEHNKKLDIILEKLVALEEKRS
ncbi:MAG: acylphosphatase [Thermoplasmata archaeon]